SLIVENVCGEDAGTYRCVVHTPAGQTTIRGELHIKEKQQAPLFLDEKVSQEKFSLPQGQEMNKSFTVTGSPTPHITWYKDGEPLDDTRRIDIRSRGNVYYLGILNLKPEDAGTYTCEAGNRIGAAYRSFEVDVTATLKRAEHVLLLSGRGSAMFMTTLLHIPLPFLSTVPKPKDKWSLPAFSSKLRPLETLEGEETKFVVNVSGEPIPTVEWFKDDTPIKHEDRFRTYFDGRVCMLVFRKTGLDDQGIYKCVLRNDVGTVSSSANLIVSKKSASPQVVPKIKFVDSFECSEARLEAHVAGVPRPTVEWFLGSAKLCDGERYRLEQTDNLYTLVISNLHMEDTGPYKIIATNEHGSTGSVVEWFKNDKPVKHDHLVRSYFDGKVIRLIVRRTTLEDAGLYRCTILNDLGTASSMADLSVN
ncbi:predicted protein, partial [Nematostella vectensis]